jgi:hypothetical protein
MSHKCVNYSQLSAVTVLYNKYAERQGLNLLTSTVLQVKICICCK